MTSVFISHSSRNNDTARDLRNWLRKQGFEAPFLDIDPEAGLQPGDDWERRLYEAIDHCQALLIVLTPEWLASKWCFAEFTQARAFGKPILPLIHAGVSDEDLRSFAPQIQRLDLRRERVAGMTRLGEALTQISLSSGQGYDWPPKSDRDRSPYPGLESFQEEDAAVFCGRDDEIRAVLEHLHARRVQWGQSLLMVVGSRGAGKSSLLRAGVIPRLKRLAKQWIVLPPFRPHPDPCGALAAALSQCGVRGGWDAVRQRLLDADSSNDLRSTWLRMAQELQEHASSPNARILIAIDQGEELVFEASDKNSAGLNHEEAHRFFRWLKPALASDLPFQALITIASNCQMRLGRVPWSGVNPEACDLI